MKPGKPEITLEELRAWGKDTMASYRIPSIMKVRCSPPQHSKGMAALLNEGTILVRMGDGSSHARDCDLSGQVLPDMPVNAMGKVNKKDLNKRYTEGTL